MSAEFDRLSAMIDNAVLAYRDGDINLVRKVLNEAVSAAMELQEFEERVFILATSHMLTAALHQDRGEYEQALLVYRNAEDAAAGTQTHKDLLGQVQLCLLQLYYHLDLEDEARRYFLLAKDTLRGTADESFLDGWEDILGTPARDPATWREQVVEIDNEIADLERVATGRALTFEEKSRLRSLKRNSAGKRILYGSPAEVAAGFQMLTASARQELTGDIADWEILEAASSFALISDRPDVDVQSQLLEFANIAFAAGARANSPEFTGEGHFLAALHAHRAGDLRTAMGHALTSVALGADCLVKTNSAFLRRRLGHSLNNRRDLALMIAVGLNDPTTAAELVETARLQTLPQEGLQITSSTNEPATQREALATTYARLGVLNHVSVGSTSQMSGRSTLFAESDRRVIPLEEAIRVVGGGRAWWWGSFVVERNAHWVVRSPDGPMSCGTNRISDDQVLTIERLNDDLQNVDKRIVWANPDEEFALMSDLADLIIPPVLRNHLLASSEEVSLVVCGNWLAAIPLPALVIDRDKDVRLVDRAVVRVQPPAFLVRNILPSKVSAEKGHPLLIACTDPTGDLVHSKGDGLTSLIFLTNSKHEPRPWAQATRANLILALDRFARGAPGIFFYSGHVASLDVDGGLNSALALQGSDVIAAGDWLGTFDGTPRLKTPARVVISACNSSGSAGAGGGEWLGLAAALLSAGAQQVIATAWPICDTKFTKQFESALVSELELVRDPAHLLAKLQREALRDWRARKPGRLGQKALPVIWAAYQCIGLC